MPIVQFNKIIYADHVVVCDGFGSKEFIAEYVRNMAEELSLNGTAQQHRRELFLMNNDGSWKVMKKKVKLNLVGLGSNAFSLMGAFTHAARRQGWSKEEIDAVMADCQSGDYDHLLGVLMENTEDEDD